MSERVMIRPAEISDAEEMFRTIESESVQNLAYFKREPNTLERQSIWLSNQIKSNSDMLFVILAGDKMVGTCGLHEINRNGRNARLGVMLFSPRFQGRRYMSRAVRQLVTLAFKEFDLYKIYLNVICGNRVSLDKYLHLGFQFECRLIKHYFDGQQFRDMNCLYLFADEWNEGE
jgi:RimJ/RimL family protein N-acetyltransferase